MLEFDVAKCVLTQGLNKICKAYIYTYIYLCRSVKFKIGVVLARAPVCPPLACLGLHHRLGFRWVIVWELIPCSDRRGGRNQFGLRCAHRLPVPSYQVYFHCETSSLIFSPLFSIIVETVVRSSVMPVLTTNCLCLRHPSLFGSAIPAMPYLYSGARLMCHKILLQDTCYLLVFSESCKQTNKTTTNECTAYCQGFR